MSARSLGRASVFALANAVLLTLGSPAHADEIEVPQESASLLLSSDLPLSPPREEDRFSSTFGIRKGRGFQVVKPIEMNDRKYEFNLSGPLVKSKTKKKSLGLSFEFRF